MNQTIKIFLASSSELLEDRKSFEIFIGRQNNILIEKGIYLKLIIWENFLDAMSDTRLQEEYNNAIFHPVIVPKIKRWSKNLPIKRAMSCIRFPKKCSC
ncbi:MAG: hypothetical protein ACI8P3_002491 [Saprospiraceae bacterium]|jgi:hypothetical protein